MANQEETLAASSAPGWQSGSMYERIKSNKKIYLAFVLAVTCGAIVLMVIPAELVSKPPPEDAQVDLETTFSTLVCASSDSLVYPSFWPCD